MVASVQEHAVGTKPLVGIQEESDFCRPRSSVHKVAIKKVIVLIGGSPVQSEELHQVVVLAYTTGQLFLVIV